MTIAELLKNKTCHANEMFSLRIQPLILPFHYSIIQIQIERCQCFPILFSYIYIKEFKIL